MRLTSRCPLLRRNSPASPPLNSSVRALSSAMESYEKSNRDRLSRLIQKIETRQSPLGWTLTGSIAVGGLTEIGFSKRSEHLLVISSRGRGVVSCDTGEKVARDYETDGDWLDLNGLLCLGIGPISEELIQIAGLHGGGLPLGNGRGEHIEVAYPNWPRAELIFCANYKSAFVEGHHSHCSSIASDYLRSFGFSWSGNSLAYATGSDVHVFSRDRSGL